MKWTVLPLILIAIGFGMMVCSPLWKVVFSPAAVWSDEQAQELASAGAKVHQLNYARGKGEAFETAGDPVHEHHADGIPEGEAEVEAEFEKAKQDYELARKARDGAIRWRTLPANLLWYGGMLMIALGAAAHFLLMTPWLKQFVEE
jgi:hypothetical protein